MLGKLLQGKEKYKLITFVTPSFPYNQFKIMTDVIDGTL